MTRCEDCTAPGGEVTIKRAGVIVWRRVLCEPCFHTRRVNTLAGRNVSILKTGVA